jgi:hypothetical protein
LTSSWGGSADLAAHHADAHGPPKSVQMYCTGGIRCDIYSTFLRQRGYKNLYTLEGGIQVRGAGPGRPWCALGSGHAGAGAGRPRRPACVCFR